MDVMRETVSTNVIAGILFSESLGIEEVRPLLLLEMQGRTRVREHACNMVGSVFPQSCSETIKNPHAQTKMKPMRQADFAHPWVFRAR